MNKYLSILIVITFLSCEETYVPKPRGYHRIDLPDHTYTKLVENHPYSFEYSNYAIIKPHVSSISEPHWIDIVYPAHNAIIQITYKDLSKDKLSNAREKFLNELVNDSYKLTSKHQIKAYAIDESIVKTPSGKTATVFELEGDVPSQFQFYITDTTHHFIRGALYFRTSTKNDSLKPIIEYIKIDMLRLLNTLNWKNSK